MIFDEPTNQIAELRACLTALERIIDLQEGNVDVTGGLRHHLSGVIIKADSEYVVKGMTDWILTWRTNGYKSYNEGPVKNAWYFQWMDDCINHLEGMGVNVQFWHVLRDSNKEADRLANEAFNHA